MLSPKEYYSKSSDKYDRFLIFFQGKMSMLGAIAKSIAQLLLRPREQPKGATTCMCALGSGIRAKYEADKFVRVKRNWCTNQSRLDDR